MDLGFVSGVAVALAIDACTVTLAVGLALGGLSGRQVFRLVWHFALFQAAMPAVGWAGGMLVEPWIRAWDHWLAFGLLAVVGAKMIVDGWRQPEAAAPATDPTRGWSLVIMSVATSIDAMAVGLSLGVLDAPIWRAALTIGVVTAVLTLAVALIGRRVKLQSARRAGVLGGAVLLVLGGLILAEHLAG